MCLAFMRISALTCREDTISRVKYLGKCMKGTSDYATNRSHTLVVCTAHLDRSHTQGRVIDKIEAISMYVGYALSSFFDWLN